MNIKFIVDLLLSERSSRVKPRSTRSKISKINHDRRLSPLPTTTVARWFIFEHRLEAKSATKQSQARPYRAPVQLKEKKMSQISARNDKFPFSILAVAFFAWRNEKLLCVRRKEEDPAGLYPSYHFVTIKHKLRARCLFSFSRFYV